MKIELDTNNITELDRNVLQLVLGGEVEKTSTPAPAAKAAPAKAAPAKKAEPTPDPEPEEDLLGNDGPTMADAVSAATVLVSNGGAAKVKEALATVGAKRVSEIADDQIALFLSSLEA